VAGISGSASPAPSSSPLCVALSREVAQALAGVSSVSRPGSAAPCRGAWHSAGHAPVSELQAACWLSCSPMAPRPQISPEPGKCAGRVKPLVLAPTGSLVLARSHLMLPTATSVRGDRSIPAASPAVGVLCRALGRPQAAAERLGGVRLDLGEHPTKPIPQQQCRFKTLGNAACEGGTRSPPAPWVPRVLGGCSRPPALPRQPREPDSISLSQDVLFLPAKDMGRELAPSLPQAHGLSPGAGSVTEPWQGCPCFLVKPNLVLAPMVPPQGSPAAPCPALHPRPAPIPNCSPPSTPQLPSRQLILPSRNFFLQDFTEFSPHHGYFPWSQPRVNVCIPPA